MKEIFFWEMSNLYFPWVKDLSICKIGVKIIFDFVNTCQNSIWALWNSAKLVFGLCKISAKLVFGLYKIGVNLVFRLYKIGTKLVFGLSKTIWDFVKTLSCSNRLSRSVAS